MPKCNRCGKFKFMGLKDGYCKECKDALENERRIQQAEAERLRKEEEESRRLAAERLRKEEEEARKLVEKNGDIKIGSVVRFGKFEQDGKHADPTPVNWIVLRRDGNKALLLSQYALDEEAYNGGTEYMLEHPNGGSYNTTWENCTLRKKLNGEFFNKVFSKEEQKAILVTRVPNGPNECTEDQKRYGGNDTDDRVFLLSYGEAERYLGEYPSSPLRIAKQTKYCRAWGNEHDFQCRDPWWLRSPQANGAGAVVIKEDGHYAYQDVERYEVAIRPALWVDLSKWVFDITVNNDVVGTSKNATPQQTGPKVSSKAIRTLLVTDPMAFFAALGRANGLTPKNNIEMLGENEICFKRLPSGSVRITTAWGNTLVVNNNVAYAATLEKYGCDTSSAYTMPNVIRQLEIENGAYVYIEKT